MTTTVWMHFSKQDDLTWTISKSKYTRQQGTLKRGLAGTQARKQYSLHVTHLDIELDLGVHDKITDAKLAAQDKLAELKDVTPEQHAANKEYDAAWRRAHLIETGRTKLIESLVRDYQMAKKAIVDACAEVKSYYVDKGYREGYYRLRDVMVADARKYAVVRSIAVLMRENGHADFERAMLEESARQFSSATSTSMMSNAERMAYGDALRDRADWLKYSVSYDAAFECGWDFSTAIKAALPEMFKRD